MTREQQQAQKVAQAANGILSAGLLMMILGIVIICGCLAVALIA